MGGEQVRAWFGSTAGVREEISGGDWAGALRAAGFGVGAMFGYVLLLTLLGVAISGGDPGFGQIIGFAAIGTALAAGGNVESDVGSIAGATISFLPLMATALGFAVLSWTFLRGLRATGTPHLKDVALQAVRVWVIMLGLLLVVCLVARTRSGGSSGLGSSGLGALGPRVTADIAATLFFGSLLMWFVLAAVVAWRMPEVLPERVRGWRESAAGPTVGVLVAAVLSCVGSAVTITIFLITESKLDGAAVTGFLLIGPNLLLMVFGFALGVPLAVAGGGVLGQLGGISAGDSVSVLDATDFDGRFWLLVIFNMLAVLIGGVVAALHAASPEEARRNGWRLGLAMAAFLALVAGLTAVSGGSRLFAGSISAEVHLVFALAVMIGLAWGALAGWVGGQLAPGLPPPMIAFVRRWVRPAGAGGPQPPTRGQFGPGPGRP